MSLSRRSRFGLLFKLSAAKDSNPNLSLSESTVRNLARRSSPLPERERTKVRVLIQRAFFARDSRFCLCSEPRLRLCNALLSEKRLASPLQPHRLVEKRVHYGARLTVAGTRASIFATCGIASLIRLVGGDRSCSALLSSRQLRSGYIAQRARLSHRHLTLSSRPPANICGSMRMRPGNKFTPAMDQNGFSADPMPNSLMKPANKLARTSPDQPGNGRMVVG